MKQIELTNHEREKVIAQLIELGFSKEAIDSESWKVFSLIAENGVEYARKIIFDETLPDTEFSKVFGRRSFLTEVWDSPVDLVFEEYEDIMKALS